MSRSCRRRLKLNERTAIESRIQALPRIAHRQQGFDQGTTNFETAKEKEVRQLEELDQAQATVKGPIAEYQEQLVKVEQAKAAYQEASNGHVLTLMDEIKNKRAFEAIQKNFIVTYLVASRVVLQEAERLEASVGLLVRI